MMKRDPITKGVETEIEDDRSPESETRSLLQQGIIEKTIVGPYSVNVNDKF